MGKDEVYEGLPFRPGAQAGSVLERAIRRVGMDRQSFVLWNVVPTHPPNDYLVGAPYYHDAIAWGLPQLEAVIERFKPRVILALGATALRVTTGLAGEKLGISNLTGFLMPSRWLGISIVPCFHPAFLRRGKMSHMGVLMRALRHAVRVAREGLEPTTPPVTQPPEHYMLHPTPEQAEEFYYAAKHIAEFIAYDIETPYSTEEDSAEEAEGTQTIKSIQFSLSAGSGVFLPWREPYIQIAKRVLSLPQAKLGWNTWRFDDPVLREAGVPVAGESHDLMWMWHHCEPDLPRGLQFAAGQMGWPWPWKHLDAAAPAFYGIVDVDVLQWMRPKLLASLSRSGTTRGYQRYVVRLQPILESMSARGIPIDPVALAKCSDTVQADKAAALAKLQELVPDEVHPHKEYKRKPRATLVWKPSNKGLVAYMRMRQHPVPKHFKTGRDTTNQLELERLERSTHDPVYKTVLEYREAGTILDNHVHNWRPTGDGRVHPTFYPDPATGQLSARRPNSQNAPHHTGYATLFRSMIVPSPDHLLLEFDYKSFHVQTLAFEARDPNMLRLAKLDIHSFLVAHLLHLPHADECIGWDDAQLGDYLAHIKREHKHTRDAKVKHALLGYNNGMGYRKLYVQYKEFFESQAEAKQVMGLLDSLFPITKAYRDAVCYKAHEQGYLVSRYGCMRRFWEVFQWKGGQWSPHGDDHEAALCFYTQNDAHCYIKEAMIRLDDAGWLERAGLCNTVHDSLKFNCPRPLVERAVEEIACEMQRPSDILRDDVIAPLGLSVEVEVKGGVNWAEMKGL